MAAPLDAKKQLLQRSWTTVASGYQQLFVPRFMPWTLQTLDALISAGLPAGDILVPCCGPGKELELLAQQLPTPRRIIGLDLSEGMVELARERIVQLGLSDRVEALVGDAAHLNQWQGLAGVVSVFGLQQIPDAHAVLAAWTRALRPGGIAAVCFWGKEVEQEGPWKRLIDLTVASRPAGDWEAQIPAAALREGAELLCDCSPEHEMSWPSADDFWEGMVHAGPWHSRLLQYGEGHMAQLRKDFMAAYLNPRAALSHKPRARLVVLRRLAAAL